MTLPIARDLAPMGIRVMTIAPGRHIPSLPHLGLGGNLWTIEQGRYLPSKQQQPSISGHREAPQVELR